MGRCGWILLLTLEVALATDTCAKDSLDEECRKQLSGGIDGTTAVDQFKKEGWTVVKNVLDKEFLEEVRNHVDYLLRKYPEIPGGKIHV
jgi:hypothetical protein